MEYENFTSAVAMWLKSIQRHFIAGEAKNTELWTGSPAKAITNLPQYAQTSRF